jgi:hypothetical protein
MSNHGFRRFFLVVLLLLAAGPPAFADVKWRIGGESCRVGDTRHPAANAADSPLVTQPAVVLADVWSLGHFFTGGGRTRIVQMCVVAMCLALFIMMKKVNG